MGYKKHFQVPYSRCNHKNLMRDREKAMFPGKQTACLNHATIFQDCLLNTCFANSYYILTGVDFEYIAKTNLSLVWERYDMCI